MITKGLLAIILIFAMCMYMVGPIMIMRNAREELGNSVKSVKNHMFNRINMKGYLLKKSVTRPKKWLLQYNKGEGLRDDIIEVIAEEYASENICISENDIGF